MKKLIALVVMNKFEEKMKEAKYCAKDDEKVKSYLMSLIGKANISSTLSPPTTSRAIIPVITPKHVVTISSILH